MADLDPFEVVRRLGHAPLGPLVDALRQIHHRGKVEPNNLKELLGSNEAAFAGPKPPSAPTQSTSPDYEAARRHFVRHSVRLREQAILAERLLEGLAGPAKQTPPGALQHELRIQCARGATSGARFIVVNCLDRAVDVHFRPGRVHAVSPEQAAAIRLSFTPEQPRLESGAEQEVQLLVEVGGNEGLPDALELGVDVLGHEQLLLKLWVRIELHPGGIEWTNGSLPLGCPE
jgi:hypothetical protein